MQSASNGTYFKSTVYTIHCVHKESGYPKLCWKCRSGDLIQNDKKMKFSVSDPNRCQIVCLQNFISFRAGPWLLFQDVGVGQLFCYHY